MPGGKGVDGPAGHGGDGLGVLAPGVAVGLSAFDHAATGDASFDDRALHVPPRRIEADAPTHVNKDITSTSTPQVQCRVHACTEREAVEWIRCAEYKQQPKQTLRRIQQKHENEGRMSNLTGNLPPSVCIWELQGRALPSLALVDSNTTTCNVTRRWRVRSPNAAN